MDNQWHKMKDLPIETQVKLEGIYKFPDKDFEKKKIYIGQSENIFKRLAKHIFGNKLDV
jgi:excinuclease UvrABC nuclease subunit